KRGRKEAPMRYLILLYDPPRSAEPDPADVQAEMARWAAFTRETIRRGVYQGGNALQPATTATTVRLREGRTLTTDGPFAETKEELGGYYLLDCRDLDEAIELAAMTPTAERGSVEIRPIWELPAADHHPPAGATEASGRGAATGG
ncbi:MAG TPA: YciI family protein, partial [Candidatus Limnocylindrales bacterium]|nr:YciI family protein [Candidatus Limnocylindrales bacterium]